MNRLREKFLIFMQGRYGYDELGKFLVYLDIILVVINAFFHNRYISAFITLVVLWYLFRIFSKSIANRQRENAKFLQIKYKVKKIFEKHKARMKDKDHIYRKCPHCKATLRFPKVKGKHDAKCPKCRKEFKVRVL